jgi:hypothetical protein
MAEKRRLEPPSEEEIVKLTHWARVAFAARCARRVQPLAEEKSLIEAPRKGTRMVYFGRMGAFWRVSDRIQGVVSNEQAIRFYPD